jgi:CO dehydrogenase maturation factor
MLILTPILQALGIPQSANIVPISNMKELIEERTETKLGSMGSFFKLNPKVDDLPDKLSIKIDNIKLMVLGSVKKGAGCICPSTLLKNSSEAYRPCARRVIVLDMEAGLERLGRNGGGGQQACRGRGAWQAQH